MNLISDIKVRLKKLYGDPRTKKVQHLLQRLIALVIIGLILHQLMAIGWRNVLQSLPTHPLFYVLFVVMYIELPVAEIFIYRQVWPIGKWEGFKAFLTKRVYNHEVMGYSGEFYLFLWGRKRVDKDDKTIFKNVRDNAIISSVTSNLVAVILLSTLLYTGKIEVLHLIDEKIALYIGAGIVVLVVLTFIIIQFRQYLFELPARKAVVVFSIYLFRFLIHHSAMMIMWLIVIPGIPLSVWFTFLAIFIVVNRIPFIPSKDLVFMWAGIEFARGLEVAVASVAGMLLVYSALKKVTNLVLYLLISYYGNDSQTEQVMGGGNRSAS
ncbi:MAG: hypothetical protein WD097_03680 [Balneolales bacterium]